MPYSFTRVLSKSRTRRIAIQLVILCTIYVFVPQEFWISGSPQRVSVSHIRPSRTVVIPENSGEALSDAFKQTLETLSPHTVSQDRYNRFRRILTRDAVGLQWDWYPEQFWEEVMLPRLHRTVNVVDVGANTGQFAIPNAKRGHSVISFEPNPETCKELKRKVKAGYLSSQVGQPTQNANDAVTHLALHLLSLFQTLNS